MSGGLLAIKRKFFHEMGEYDTSMEIWGAENIEMSVRVGYFLSNFCIYIWKFFTSYQMHEIDIIELEFNKICK